MGNVENKHTVADTLLVVQVVDSISVCGSILRVQILRYSV
jgi:hypothetical protein